MKYGVPYKGSKNSIAADIINCLPPGEVFYDLFAGGCAVTHAAMLSGKYKRFIVNDIDRRGVTLFKDAIEGKYHNERRIIDREFFHANKDTDAYVALCWSFGNNVKHYLWNKDLDGVKLRVCKMILADSWHERLDAYRDFILFLQKKRIELKERKEKTAGREKEIGNIKEYLRGILCDALKVSGYTQKDVDRFTGTQMSGHYFGKSQWSFPTHEEYEKIRELLITLPPYSKLEEDLQNLQSLQSLESLERLERLESLESLERLQRLQSLERLQRLCFNLTVSVNSFCNIQIEKTGAVVYCDPPYKGTDGYAGGEFDYNGFYEWLRTRDFPVYVSEYSMPDDFVPIWRKGKRVSFSSANNSLKKIECLFVHERWKDSIMETNLFDL